MGIDYASKFLALRKQHKLSQKELAKIAEVGQTTISDIESGKKSPTAVTVEKVCEAVGITLAEFFTEKPQELETELRRLLDSAHKLTPEQRASIQKLMETMKT
jgi:HTH-type transcriptional regulator, repressor for puuD